MKKSLILLTIIIILFSGYFIFVNKGQQNSIPETKKNTVIPTPENWDEIVHGDITKKQVIFTFDGGSTADSLDKILEVLSKHSVKGTFFLTGKFIEQNKEGVKKIISAGHEIFNHTYDHKDLTTLGDNEIRKELDMMSQILTNLTGISPKPYFRAPYGARNERVLEQAKFAGYRSIYWTTDALDWKVGETKEQVRNRVLSNVKPGSIYLMHVGDIITGQVLDELMSEIENKGYKIVSLTQGI